jgi:hypothetical protein
MSNEKQACVICGSKLNKLLYCPICHEYRNHKLIDGKWICYLCDNGQVIIPEGFGIVRNTMSQFVESICKELEK